MTLASWPEFLDTKPLSIMKTAQPAAIAGRPLRKVCFRPLPKNLWRCLVHPVEILVELLLKNGMRRGQMPRDHRNSLGRPWRARHRCLTEARFARSKLQRLSDRGAFTGTVIKRVERA